MSKLPKANSNEIHYQGGMNIFICSGLMDLVTAVTAQGYFLVPFAATVIDAMIKVVTACGTAAATFSAGIVGTAGYIVNAQSIATTDAAATIIKPTIANSAIAANTLIYFSADGGATSTGDAVMTLLLRPAIQS